MYKKGEIMTEDLVNKTEDGVTIPPTTLFNMKAVVDGLVFGHPDIELSIALDENTIIPLQAVLVTSDKEHMILGTRHTAKMLASTGKAKQVFQSMSDEEKIKKIGK